MSTISFKSPPPATKPQPEETPADSAEVSKAITPVADQAPAVVPHGPAVASGVIGEVSMSDIKLPRINLIQKVGTLADQFTPGSIVFEKSIVLSDGKTPVDLTPLQIRKQYQRKTAWGEGDSNEQPEVYDTAAEVREAGGSLQYGDDNYFAEIAHIQFAIKLPVAFLSDELKEAAEVVDLFPYQLGDSTYAIAMWTVASSAYTAMAKPLFTAAASLLRNGLYHGHYSVTSEIRKNAKNSWYAPRPVFAGKHTPEAAEFFKQIAGL
jgi:hypothetical protein